MTTLSEPLRAALPILAALESLAISHHLGGSMACAVHGAPRTTNDIDIVVALEHRHVAPLLVTIGDDYYSDAEAIHHAIRRGSSVNLIHMGSGLKIDLFIAGTGAFDRQEMARHRVENLNSNPPIRIAVKSAEDILLRKLAWFELGRRASDRQWSDVLGIVAVQGDQLDHSYLRRWAQELEVTELLDAALREAPKPERE